MARDRATVFVVDDDEAVRDSLCRLFSSVGLTANAFSSGEMFLSSYELGEAGCLLIDLRMPGKNAFDVQRELTERAIGLPVIFITGHGDVETGVRAMKAGAFDFIEKPFRDQVLLELVQKAIGQSVDELKNGAAIQEIQQDFGRLTARERQVLDGVVAGEPNKRIAHALGMSEKTVEYHRSNLMKKTRARSLADLIKKALRVLPPAPNR